MSESIIRFVDVTKAYDDEAILERFSLDIGRGEFLTIIGSSGCGKTTLLKMINGLLIPDKGTVFVQGRVLYRGSRKRCEVCGAAFVPKSNRGKYCPDCAGRMKKLKAAERKRKQRQKCHALEPFKPA